MKDEELIRVHVVISKKSWKLAEALAQHLTAKHVGKITRSNVFTIALEQMAKKAKVA